MRVSRFIPILAIAAAVSAPALSAPAPATELCGSTTFSSLAASDCRGAFVGNINGDPSETVYLAGQWSGPFTYMGKSDDIGFGPFSADPGLGPLNVTLSFDNALSGTFVIGLKAAANYSYYLFNAASPVSSLTFNTTAGVAVNANGMPQEFSHANLYVGPVPEPESYAMMLAGLGLMGFIARRRKQQDAAA